MIQEQKTTHGLTVSFNTTEDCNLRCKYCYETCKKPQSLSFSDAKSFVDLLMEDPDPLGFLGTEKESFAKNLYRQGIILDFIGGDALMDVEFLDAILKYFIYRVNTSSGENPRRWRSSWRINISTNGTLFEKPSVRAFCEKYRHNLSMGVSLDGCPSLHDMNRVFPDGSGSMNSIIHWWPWYRRNFPLNADSTKSTLAKNSIPYLYDSLLFLHEKMGIRHINQNFIMENMNLKQQDLNLLDAQMEKCVRYVLLHRKEMFWSMIKKETFAEHHLSRGLDWFDSGHCGSGCMPALGTNGMIYPCFRWLPHTQNNKVPYVAGSIKKGLYNKSAFKQVLTKATRSSCTKESKCKTCEYESACPYCIGGCFAEYGDFRRTTHICEVIKLQCKWSKIYWNEYNRLEGLKPEYPTEFCLKGVRDGIYKN